MVGGAGVNRMAQPLRKPARQQKRAEGEQHHCNKASRSRKTEPHRTRPAGHGVEEGQGQPAHGQGDQQQQRETDGTPGAEPVDQAAEADDHQDHRQTEGIPIKVPRMAARARAVRARYLP